MTGRRAAQVAAVLVQVLVLAAVVGRVDALTVPGEVLAVLLPLVGSLVAATRRLPVLLVPVGLVLLVAATAAGLPLVLHVAGATAVLVQLLVVDLPPTLVVGRVVGTGVALGGLAVVVGAVGLALGSPPSALAVVGPATVAVVLLVVTTARGDR